MKHLHAMGARVIATGRRTERLRDLIRELEADETTLIGLDLDLRSSESIANAFETGRKQWGGIDILINNAGVGYKSSLLDGDQEQWREMWEVNVMGLSLCTREAIADFRRRACAGFVINISSLSGHRVPRGMGFYAATKFAVRALTEGVRQELRDQDSNIRVAQISPGIVESEFHLKLYGSSEKADELYAQVDALKANDIAAAVAFVLTQPSHVEIHDILVRPTDQKT